MSQRKFLSALYFVLFSFLTSQSLFAQAFPKPAMNSAEIKLALKKIQVLGNVLYVAAHPDDENTRLLTYFSKHEGYRTGYLGLTRGDGGQNLIGTEVREKLGLIRTQELLAARRTDGAEQFFSRANDFGYSKSKEETLTIWDKEQVLSDMVWTIRNFQPDVMVTRFSPTYLKTHGHHLTSAVLAKEAFEAAADPNRFPEQLKYTKVWQVKRLVWNSWMPQYIKGYDSSDLDSLNVGQFNVLLGQDYREIAAQSRSMHKSQGFGALKSRGQLLEYFEHLAGEKSEKGLFSDIETTWARVEGAEKATKLLEKAYQEFNIEKPESILPTLLDAHREMQKLSGNRVAHKMKELEDIIFQCAGIWTEVNSQQYSVTANDSLKLTVNVIKRSNFPVRLEQVDFKYGSSTQNTALTTGVLKTIEKDIFLPAETQNSQAYWLQKPSTKGMFTVDNQQIIGMPENPYPVPTKLDFVFGDKNPLKLSIIQPVFYKWRDPVQGEKYRLLEITPAVTANIQEAAYLFADQNSQTVEVLLKSQTQNTQGKLTLDVPKSWKVEPSSIDFSFGEKYEEMKVKFTVSPPKNQSEGEISAKIKLENGTTLNQSIVRINYEHIPIQTLFPIAKAKIARLDIKKTGNRVGYIMGAGDEIPAALRQVGYKVDMLADEDINQTNLKKYDAIITGVRAYNTNERLKFQQEILMKYVENGGNLIVQYNTNHALKTKDLAPYPLELSRDRVTVEEAEVRFLKPNHAILNTPNKITEADFENWVQERGLYFPNKWDEKFEAILSANDLGETPKDGGLLTCKYGKGTYIYTGYSWFRELPAGVVGAYRIFANMISYKQ
jgi:LmbE family N-acetylglucosaminyl deacetylase